MLSILDRPTETHPELWGSARHAERIAVSAAPAPSQKSRFMKQAWVGLGSNLEEPITQLTNAYRRLATNPQIQVEAASSVYLSAPRPQDQPDFYNAVLSLRTSMTPENCSITANNRNRDGQKTAQALG